MLNGIFCGLLIRPPSNCILSGFSDTSRVYASLVLDAGETRVGGRRGKCGIPSCAFRAARRKPHARGNILEPGDELVFTLHFSNSLIIHENQVNMMFVMLL
jgi:hypothetical protein